MKCVKKKESVLLREAIFERRAEVPNRMPVPKFRQCYSWASKAIARAMGNIYFFAPKSRNVNI